MKTTKTIAAMAGISWMLFGGAPGGFAEVFTDDFNRADGPLGAGWQTSPGASWGIVSQVAKAIDDYPFGAAYATNFTLGSNYTISVDQLVSDGVFNRGLFGNRPYVTSPTNMLLVFLQPNLQQVDLRTVVNGSITDYTIGTPSFVIGTFYHLTLFSSNGLTRSTVTGSNVNVDTGWHVNGVPAGGYGGIFDVGDYSYDNFSLISIPEPGSLAILSLGAAGLLLLRRSRKQ